MYIFHTTAYYLYQLFDILFWYTPISILSVYRDFSIIKLACSMGLDTELDLEKLVVSSFEGQKNSGMKTS